MIIGLFFWVREKFAINSFWDVIRNPNALPDLDAFHEEVDEKARKLSGSEARVAKLVDYYVFKVKSAQDAWTELRTLAKLGEETYPRALEILRDSSLQERLVILRDSEVSLPECPLNRLCELFDQDAAPPREAAELLGPYLESESDEIRKSVALTIGSIASPESLPDLQLALNDDAEYVRSFALMGIQRAIIGNRIEDEFRKEIFELVSDMWPNDTAFATCDDIPKVLLKLDRERATKYLLTEELFSVHFEPVWPILEALIEEKVEVPRPRLLKIIADASNEPIEYPLNNVMEGALPLLGAHRNAEDAAMFETFLNHSDEKVARGASEALYQFHQFKERIRDPWDVVDSRGWSALTIPEKHILAIKVLDSEVNNGGFAQYYFNSSGDHWKEALEGLVAIGAKKHHALMQTTVEKFAVKPSSNRSQRNSQLSTLVSKQEDPFRQEDDQWYSIKDEFLDPLVLKYNLANLEGREKLD